MAKTKTTADDIEELELDELEPAEEVKKAPPKKKRKSKGKAKKDSAPAVKFGSKELAAHISENTEHDIDARKTRILLRKLREDGTIDHDKNARYSWEGPDDPEVKQVMEAIENGALDASRGGSDDDEDDSDEE